MFQFHSPFGPPSTKWLLKKSHNTENKSELHFFFMSGPNSLLTLPYSPDVALCSQSDASLGFDWVFGFSAVKVVNDY